MKRDQKQRLAQSLPPDSPYYQLVFRDEPEKLRTASMAQRVEVACADPAFFLHVAQSYAHTGLTFTPNCVAPRCGPGLRLIPGSKPSGRGNGFSVATERSRESNTTRHNPRPTDLSRQHAWAGGGSSWSQS